MRNEEVLPEKYIPATIEQKWQEKWASANIYSSRIDGPNPSQASGQARSLGTKKKYYVLAEFAYPSGDLHMGHWFTWVGADVFARFKRMQGHNVFFPNGFDAFGLPAENAAIKRGIHPRDWTIANIEKMKKQYMSMGPSFTFDHEVITCDADYYRWNQWIFLEMYKKGLAYLGKKLSNWCPNDQTVLANEGIEDGKCWRCGAVVEQKEISQWFFKITAYADRLEWPVNPVVDWPKAIMHAQNDWIGKSTGALIHFKVQDAAHSIDVFTTRPDTLYGATFIVLAPEHPLVAKITTTKQEKEVEDYIGRTKNKTELERKEMKEKTGVFTGAYVINPISNQHIPVWIADYALMGYGTGALFGDAHDERDVEFAKKYKISLKATIITGDKEKDKRIISLEECFTGYGILIDSGEFSGLTSKEAMPKVIAKLEQNKSGKPHVVYHLHDWSVSRQRYWGTPVPMIHCEKCGIVPVPEKDLPVELPYDVDYAPKGEPPLATNKEWLAVTCPTCGGQAKRDAETMDTFVDSSWYFFRFLDPKNDKEPFSPSKVKSLMPVDIYFGGAEHTLGHTLYSRFFTKFLHDIGLTDLEEYATRRINHGIILGPDNAKMSKSKGNVVNPDEEVKRFGADAIRVYLSFFIPYEGTGPWVSEKVYGAYRFLQRVWDLQRRIKNQESRIKNSKEDLRMMHWTIKKVSEDIELIHFNTAIAALMEWLNYLSKKEQVSQEEYKTFLLLLAPFAPHVTEELWQRLDPSVSFQSIHLHPWPAVDSAHLESDEVTIVVQVNGKVRETMRIKNHESRIKNSVEDQARELEKVHKYLEGKEVKKVVYIEGKILNFVTN